MMTQIQFTSTSAVVGISKYLPNALTVNLSLPNRYVLIAAHAMWELFNRAGFSSGECTIAVAILLLAGSNL
jgi:hypothetical protein